MNTGKHTGSGDALQGISPDMSGALRTLVEEIARQCLAAITPHTCGCTPTPQSSEQLLPIADVGQRLACGRSTVYELLNNGELESVKVGSSRRVIATSVQRFIERQREAGDL